MANVYIEKNRDGQFEVKEKGKSTPTAVAPTQKEAEEKVKTLFPGVHPEVERVRHTEKGGPGKWRKE